MTNATAEHAAGAVDRLETAGSVLDRLLVLFRADAEQHGPTRAAISAALSLYSLRDDKEVLWIAAAAIERLAADGSPDRQPESVVPGQ